jgi:hypothetical protein
MQDSPKPPFDSISDYGIAYLFTDHKTNPVMVLLAGVKKHQDIAARYSLARFIDIMEILPCTYALSFC